VLNRKRALIKRALQNAKDQRKVEIEAAFAREGILASSISVYSAPKWPDCAVVDKFIQVGQMARSLSIKQPEEAPCGLF
jgi:hypothetical protein